MNLSDVFKKDKKLFEARVPGLDYKEVIKDKKTNPYIDKVILSLEKKDSEIMTKLAFKYKKLDNLMKAITEKRNEMNAIVKEKMVDLFDAEDEFRTRVIETTSATMTLAKKGEKIPASVVTTIDYEKVATEIMSLLEGDLLQKAKLILSTYTDVQRLPEQEPKSPALTIKAKESINEKLTLKSVKNELNPLGISIKNTGWGDYRVNFKDSGENTAYYTDDLQDALDTGKYMSTEKKPDKATGAINEAITWDRLKSWAHRFLDAFKSWGQHYDKKLARINAELRK